MPSSYTPSLRLVLPVTGELSSTWGDTVNNGLTNLVDSAIAGTATVTMTDANYTLTTANEATDEARQMFIKLTGTLSATRNVVCPTVSKLYFVSNETTGGQSIVFKTSAGTGITVPNGSRMMLYCNGTNVVESITRFTGVATGYVPQTATTGSAVLPSGTQAQRDGSPAAGYIRFNTTISKFEGYNGSSWSSVGGGATGGGADEVFIENGQSVTTNYTIPGTRNALTTGPITVQDGVTVTVSDGARWVVL
jgi:hypothetical protein